MNKIFLFLLYFVGMYGSIGQNKSSQTMSKGIALDSAVRHGKLDNGFTYYLRKNDTPKNIIELHLVVKAGSYHEEDDQFEYAHLLEHVGAVSTKHFPNVKREFRHIHASTGVSYTKYDVKIPSNEKDVLQSGIQVLRDWAQDISSKQQTIDMERGAILGEMRDNNPYRRWLSDIISEKILEGYDYKSSNRLKNKLSIQNFNREAYLRFYKDWYRPDLEAAIVVGNIDLDSMELKIKNLFSDLEMPRHPRNREERINKQTIKLNGRNQYLTVLDTLQPNLRLYLVSKRINREFGPSTEADYRDMLLQQLYIAMVETKGKQLQQQFPDSFSEFSVNYRANQIGGHQINATQITVDFESDDPKHLKKKLVNALLAWKRMHIGFTNSDLINAKAKVLQNNFNSQSKSTSQLVIRYVNHFVKGAAAPNSEFEKILISEILNKISIDEVQDFILGYGNLNRNTDLLFFKGKGVNVPDNNILEQWTAEIDEMKVKPLDPPKPLIKSLARATQIIPIQKDVEAIEIVKNPIGITTVVLKNGVKLLLKPTKPANEYYARTISIHAYRPNNIPIGKREEYLIANSVPEIVRFTGAGPHSKFQLDEYMKRKGIRLMFETNKDFQIVNGEFKMADIEEWLNLLYLYITQPRQDSEGFAIWKGYKKDKLIGMNVRGSSDFYMDEIRSHWFPETPRLKAQDLEQLKMKKVFRVFKQWYSDIEDYTFVITGDFNTDNLVPILIRNLSAFPVGGRPSSERTIAPGFPLKKMDETIRLKNINQAYVCLYFPVLVTNDLKTQVVLQLLSKALHDRIWSRLRDGCYSPGAGGNLVDVKNGIHGFWVRFDSELGNENHLIQMAMEEFRSLKEKGVDQAWLKKRIAYEKASYSKNIDSYWLLNFWTDYIKKKEVSGEDFLTEVLQYQSILEHFISLEDVNVAAKKYLCEENIQKFLVLPEGYQEME